MNCPQCGNEMESGFMQTHHHPSWTQQEGPAIFRSPRDLALLVPPDEPPDAEKGMDLQVWHQYAGTMLCRSCGLAVVPCRIANKFQKDKKS